MQGPLLEFMLGVLEGGLLLSAAWGAFWLAISTTGAMRGSCGWRVVMNSTLVFTLPLAIAWLLMWMAGHGLRYGMAFGFGLSVMPGILGGLALRLAPDGQRMGSHVYAGVRQLMGQLLGAHQACSGCEHGHDHGASS
ncbi:conserved membrane protein of unknown function [Nitrospira sp. KM1]|uniref:hypothetical protein n=1 Tax=Nitrospira sp. KM1 TaxID=1936990 RepID=UPI0013A75714|nr:hypothetical protein [Nitrospira sp. KM1]BCA54385.1 conserved membrane protein of unknown function [Nitrospira sp. KM1]